MLNTRNALIRAHIEEFKQAAEDSVPAIAWENFENDTNHSSSLSLGSRQGSKESWASRQGSKESFAPRQSGYSAGATIARQESTTSMASHQEVDESQFEPVELD